MPSAPLLRTCAALLPLVFAAGCQPGGPANAEAGNHAELLAVHWGKLCDVYATDDSTAPPVPRLWRHDQLIGAEVVDDPGQRWRFLANDPATLQPRLWIDAAADSQPFRAALDELQHNVRLLTPLRADAGGVFDVVPRNAALRLTFSRPLGVDDGFFTAVDQATGRLRVRNQDAVKLLQLGGSAANGAATAAPLPLRIAVQQNQLLLDPVLLGPEAWTWLSPANAAGLPASPAASGANLRIAVALDGPLALPGIRGRSDLLGTDNRGAAAIVRDFRSGNGNDDTPDQLHGFLRDGRPLHLVSELPLRIESVQAIDARTCEVVLWKDGIAHDLDRGDGLVVPAAGGEPVRTELLADPADDAGRPEVDRVRALVLRVPGLLELQPAGAPPLEPSARADWLRQHAPLAFLHAPFTARQGDDVRWFLRFDPAPPLGQGPTEPPGTDVSVFAGVMARFDKPVDLDSVLPLDTWFLAMRDLLSLEAIEQFRSERGLPAELFAEAKFRTPYLIGSRVSDADGTRTLLRLQPLLGFYLDDAMRDAAANGAPLRYYLHLLAGAAGIRDLAGQPLDLGPAKGATVPFLVLPFTVDARRQNGVPLQPDNRVVYCCRRFAAADEDEQPSYHRPAEYSTGGMASFALADLFGAHYLQDGRLVARPTARVRAIADDQNQLAPPVESLPTRACPSGTSTNQTAVPLFPRGIQNPMNPYGARLQTVWRELDLSLSRLDPNDMDLDVAAMFWAPVRNQAVLFDEFDRCSLYLGHSERRPEPCANQPLFPAFPDSGLGTDFLRNYLFNPRLDGGYKDSGAERHTAYADQAIAIDPGAVVQAPGGNRYLPLPAFRQPYFAWRDQTVTEQGGEIGQAGVPSDTRQSRPYAPYMPSPWRNGRGEATPLGGIAPGVPGQFNNFRNLRLGNRGLADGATGGLLPSIALPLLADFETFCDRDDLPAGNGYIALGTNGWQVSLAMTTASTPNFRVYSGGKPGTCVGSGSTAGGTASGGFDGNGVPTIPGDNTFYWAMIEFLKRRTVSTAGFVDLHNPHRMPPSNTDPRLGPYGPGASAPQFAWLLDPPGGSQPAGTTVAVQFRAAGEVDPQPWAWAEEVPPQSFAKPDADNVPLDPLKACDAHIRKFDDRAGRSCWTHFYHRVVTDYVEQPEQLFDEAFTGRYVQPGLPFTPADIRYVNWRFVMTNATELSQPVSPSLQSFVLAYRLLP